MAVQIESHILDCQAGSQVSKHLLKTRNSEYFVPQIRSMSSRFHSAAQLPLVMRWPLANHIITYLMKLPVVGQCQFPTGCSLPVLPYQLLVIQTKKTSNL